MHFPQKKRKIKIVVFRRHYFSFFFPWTCNRGKEVFVFSSLFLPLSLSPRALLKPNRTPPGPPHDEKTEKSCPASDAPIGHLSRCRDRAGGPRTLCKMMGRGRVDHIPSAPINTARTEGRKGGGSTEKKKNRGERKKREERKKRKREKPKERDRRVKEPKERKKNREGE